MENNPENVVPTPVSEWKGRINTHGTPLSLPSGNTMLMKSLSPQAFLSSGLIPNPLMAIIRKAINDAEGLKPESMRQLAEDPEKLASAMEMMDRAVVHVAVAPVISMPPQCRSCGQYNNAGKHGDGAGEHPYMEGERKADILYVDELDMVDKTYIFNACLGNVRDHESFRQELSSTVGVASYGEDVQLPSL